MHYKLSVLFLAIATSYAVTASAAQQSVTNGYLTITMETDPTAYNVGIFTISTGASHPHPNQTVFYPVGTSYITLMDVGATTLWANDTGDFSDASSPGLAGYTVATMETGSNVTVTPIGTTGFEVTYTLPNFTVVEDVKINGTTLSDTNVQDTTTITNTSGASRDYGLRYLWDYQIAGNDASYFRQRNPDGSFTSTFQTFTSPTFQNYEEVDSTSSPTFSIFGTVTGGSLSPAPTTPDQVRYASWPDSQGYAWDFTNTGGNVDSDVLYYWGYGTPLTLAASASKSFTQYVSTVYQAVGGGAAPTNQPVPTLNEWGKILLSAFLGIGFIVLSRRRRDKF